MDQQALDVDDGRRQVRPFKTQLLKWIGNKQRFAHEIISYFPEAWGAYHEPFWGVVPSSEHSHRSMDLDVTPLSHSLASGER